MNEAQMSKAQPALIDIVEPMAPVASDGGHGWLYALVAAAVVIIALLLFVWWSKKRPAREALQRLHALRKKLHAGEHTPHEAMLMFALEVRHGLGVKRLRADAPPEQIRAQDQSRWPEFMSELDVMLYQKEQDLQVTQVVTFIAQGEYWLKRYARKSTLRKLDV